ncbi:hypothetical protein C8F01DRAFT_1303078 [Mycena amicta]|nr:hypothetical protein C8F01DRAFT_1303078 [Mycena amicta]
MVPKLSTFLAFLNLYLDKDYSVQRALYILSVLITLYPLYRRHQNQRLAPRQPPETGWLRSFKAILRDSFDVKHEHPDLRLFEGDPDMDAYLAAQSSEHLQRMCEELPQIYSVLGMSEESDSLLLFPPSPILVCTPRTTCMFCIDPLYPSHLYREETRSIPLLAYNFRWVQATLVVAKCGKCHAKYYPDKVTYRAGPGRSRVQRLECDAAYLRVSKHGVWVHRRVARAQENAVVKFHCGWTSFTEWLNDTIESGTHTKVTIRQSQRLYLEHFARRLARAHNIEDHLVTPADCTSQILSESVRNLIGRDGGLAPKSMEHGCTECTHVKQYAEELRATGVTLDSAENAVVGSDIEELEEDPDAAGPGPINPSQHKRVAGSERGYVRMAVMDGKTITHRICAADRCENPLVNYKNGRFCLLHIDERLICGITGCGRPVDTTQTDAVTCDSVAHKDWHKKWKSRFGRLTFPGVRRVIRRLNEHSDTPNQAANPNTTVPGTELPELDGVPGKDIKHTFRARTTYCLQTVQWACGCPVGWGKCYVTESPSRALSIIDRLWESCPESRPSFLVYDESCNLLRHIITQNPQSPWLKSTKFIVDVWHYIGHCTTDVLCRSWCNPAPSNGSQPDLIQVTTDANGNSHKTRAFNTETAEQFNSWLSGYEAQLRQMSDVNYDFTIHVLMLLYKEQVEKKNLKRKMELSDEFWNKVHSTE